MGGMALEVMISNSGSGRMSVVELKAESRVLDVVRRGEGRTLLEDHRPSGSRLLPFKAQGPHQKRGSTTRIPGFFLT